MVSSTPEQYKEFGQFLNAVCESAANHGLDATIVKNGIDWLLDRGHLAEYSSKCHKGIPCTNDDVADAVLFLRKFLSGT
jgi:hypothetical protein